MMTIISYLTRLSKSGLETEKSVEGDQDHGISVVAWKLLDSLFQWLATAAYSNVDV